MHNVLEKSIANTLDLIMLIIASFDADFSTRIYLLEFNQQYVKGRRIADHTKAKMSRHIQVESRMSLTGSNADNRVLVRPSEQGAAIATLYNEVAALTVQCFSS